MQGFTYQTAPMRVIFGAGTLSQLPNELVRLGISRALVLATPNQAPQASHIAAMLGDRAAGIFAEAAMHTPVDVTDRAMAQVRELDVDGVRLAVTHWLRAAENSLHVRPRCGRFPQRRSNYEV